MKTELIFWVKVAKWEGGSWNPAHLAPNNLKGNRRYLCGTGVETHVT